MLLVAVGDFEEDEVIFSIPRNAVLNLSTASAESKAVAGGQIDSFPSWLVSPSSSLYSDLVLT
jgi:hypothetical protein